MSNEKDSVNRINLCLDFEEGLSAYIKKHYPKALGHLIISESLDARGASRGKRPRINYQVDLDYGEGPKSSHAPFGVVQRKVTKERPIIIGAGPAGLYCALRLADSGLKSIVLERGESANKRMKTIARFWRYGEHSSESNVCFGEGGAGLFSDGKLITRIKSPFISYVMKRLVDFGAPAEIAYKSNPHLGSNKIRALITEMVKFLVEKGHEVRSDTRVDEIILSSCKTKVEGVRLQNGECLYSPWVILATGHSAHDIYSKLHESNIPLEAKDFAVGVRMEHPRKLMDSLQYGKFCGAPALGTARYRLSHHNKKTGRGTYSFCMCPGGHVLSSGTESDGIVTNGMSNYSRSSPWSNSAVVVSIKAGVDFDTDDIMKGMAYQRSLEHSAYLAAREGGHGHKLPATTITDFMKGRVQHKALPKTSCPSGLFSFELSELLPKAVTAHLRAGFERFEKNIPGVITSQAVLIAPETRTSAPLRIPRDHETLQSPGVSGLYPCGEGAGYAGGITSAAVDGIRVAEAIMDKLPRA